MNNEILNRAKKVLEDNKDVIERPTPRLREFYLYKALKELVTELESLDVQGYRIGEGT